MEHPDICQYGIDVSNQRRIMKNDKESGNKAVANIYRLEMMLTIHAEIDII